MEVISILISLAAIIVAILAWHKSRVIYEIKILDDKNGDDEINKLLKNGEYTILHIKQDALNVLRTIYVLGKIK